LQNHLLIGLLLLMLGIIPNEASLPPLSRRASLTGAHRDT
jgi:hypothetical protein